MSGSDTQHLLSILRGTAAGPPPPPSASSTSSQAPGPAAAPPHGLPGVHDLQQDHSGPTPAAPLATTDSLLALFSRPHPSSADSASPSRRPHEAPSSIQHQHPHRQPQSHGPTSPMTRRSSDLLSLLQGTHAASAVQLQQDQAAGSSHAPTNGDMPASPASPPGGNASQLLGLLMGGGGPRSAPNGSSTADVASPTSARPYPLSSVPSHLRPLSPASGSDTFEATTAAPALAPGRPASSAGDGPISHVYLAVQYLVPDAPPALGAPVGLRLPRSAHPPQEPQHLSISLSAAHVEALAPSLPSTTPITLFAVPVSFPGARRAAGTWERGIAYATGGGKGRVRVIDRESGARVLLKGGKGGDIRELRVAPYALEGRRRIATVAEDGAVAVWEVTDSFESEEDARSRRIRDLDLPPSASLVRFSPDSSAQTLVVVDSSSAIHVVSLDGKAKPRQLRHDGDIADLTYSADGKLLAVVNRAGAYAVYSVDGHKLERSGSVPLVDGAEVDQVALLEPAQRDDDHVPLALAVSSQQGTVISIVSLDQAGEASDIMFSAPLGTPDAWGALAYHRATQSLLVSHSLRGSIYSFRLTFTPGTSQGVRIEHVVEQPTAEPILSFVLDPLASADPHAATGSSSTAADPDGPPSSPTRSSPPLPQLSFGALVLHPRGVSHIGLVGSVPRPPSRAPTPSTAGTGTDDDDEPHLAAMATAAGRRMSLEGSIYVASEVSVRVDEPETDELSLKVALPPVSSPPPISSPTRSAEPGARDPPVVGGASSFGTYSLSPSRAAEPALGDLGNGISGARTPVAEASSGNGVAGAGPGASSSPSPLFNVGSGGGGGEQRIRLAGPVVNAAIRSMKARQQHAVSSAALASPALSPIASAPTSASGGDSGSEREQVPGADKEKRREARGQHGEVGARELRRLESWLPPKVATAISRELDKHFQQLEQHSTAAASASTSRDQALLAAVQQTVAAAVTRAVEGALVNQVGGVVEQAVRAQMGRTVEEAITRALPVELEKQLNRPALSFALSSSIASTIAPPLERHLAGTLVKLVVPALERKLSDAVAGVVGSIHSEMVGVRKEIVQEQSGAVGILEDEVASLRREVSTLKAMMEQMHALVLRQSNESRSAAPSASPRVPQQPPSLAQHSPHHPHHPNQHQPQQYQQSHQQRHVSQPFVSAAPLPPAAVVAAASRPQPGPSSALPVAIHALPPIPRVATPPERYEELFTEAMQPQHEPSFVSLQHLVASSPLSRIDAVFPPPPALPKISMAVVLSLAYRLSQVVADRRGPLDDESKKLLLWLRRAIAACDGKQPPDLLALIPRILTNVVDNLVVRGRTLMALQDLAGANDVRLVQQYAHARLSLFAQPGAGEGFEQFRR